MLSSTTLSIICWLSLSAATPLPTESEAYRRRVLADPELAPTELLAQYAARTFAPIWLRPATNDQLGFIGPDYRRLRLKLLTVRPVAGQPGQYTVTGKSKVDANVADFEGTLRVLHVRAKKDRPRTLDDEPPIAVRSGIVLAEYELRERREQAGTGVFRGLLHARWYQDKAGQLYYDDLLLHADSYANNQGVGTWQSYRSGQTKRCNWGSYRIPNAGDLDQGAAEFSPTDKYLAQGWQQYRDAGSNPAALRAERAAWWR